MIMENQIILSKKNCHRAAVVRKIADPDLGDFQLDWRGEMINDNVMCPKFCHLAKNPRFPVPSRIYDAKEDMENWEVVSWKYEVNFEDLWEVAYRAFYGTSMTPDVRASQYIREYEYLLNEDLKTIPQEEQERYIAKFKEWVRTLFDKHSRILSAMITGPAKFPTSRNEKANNSYDTAVKEFGEWRERVQKAIVRKIEDAKPADQKITEEWEQVKADIDYRVSRGYSTVNLYNRLETIAKNGKVEITDKIIAHIKEINEKLSKPIFTNRHKFWNLPNVARAIREAQEANSNKEDAELIFDGGRVVKNYSEDRLQIIFDKKPAPDAIANLHHHGFRWAPSSGVWQRQLTANAYYAATRVIPITIEQLKAVIK